MYSGEGPLDFANLLEKQKASAKTPRDAKNERWGTCHIPRADRQIKVRGNRLRTLFSLGNLGSVYLLRGRASASGCVFAYGLSLYGVRP